MGQKRPDRNLLTLWSLALLLIALYFAALSSLPK
jgi:hypothetical protein